MEFFYIILTEHYIVINLIKKILTPIPQLPLHPLHIRQGFILNLLRGLHVERVGLHHLVDGLDARVLHGDKLLEFQFTDQALSSVNRSSIYNI